MRRSLLNQLDQFTKLLKLLVLTTLLLALPKGVKAQGNLYGDYGLQVKGVNITSANSLDVLEDGATVGHATVSYDYDSNTLTLYGADIVTNNASDRSIKYNGTRDLIIALNGDNKADKIIYYDGTGSPKLTFAKAQGATNCTLFLSLTDYQGTPTYSENGAVIEDFSSVDFGSLYTKANDQDNEVPAKYVYRYSSDPDQGKMLKNALENNRNINKLLITTAKYYPVWVGGVQVSEANKNGVTSGVVFDSDNNQLRLDGVSLTSGPIASGLENLDIYYNGTNVINSAGGGYIRGVNEVYGDVNVSFSNGDTESTLQIKNTGNLSAIEGFTTVNYGSLYLNTSMPYVYNTTLKALIDPTNITTYGETTYYTYISDLTLTTETQYLLWVNNTQVNTQNYGNILGDNTVSFAPSTGENNTNTLTLNGLSIENPIVSGLDNLTIQIQGTNSLSETSGYIYSINSSAPLTFKKGEDGSTLSIDNSVGKPAVAGFASVDYDGTYLSASHGCRYVTGDDAAIKDMKGGGVQQVTITTTQHYPLWVFGTQVTPTNMGDVRGNGTVVFNGSNELTLNGFSDSSSNAIESNLDNLTIYLKGNNSVTTYTYGYNAICSGVETASLTIAKAPDASGNVSLYLESDGDPKPSVIKGFASVDHTGLNFTSHTGTTLDGATTYDATLTSATSYQLWVGGTLVTDENKDNILEDDFNSISYDGDGTLTLKGTAISSDVDAIEVGADISALTVHLVGYNQVYPDNAFKFLGTNTTLKFTTSETLPGSLHYYGTLATGVSGDIDYKNGLVHNADNKEISATISNLDITVFTGFVSVVNEEGDKTCIMSNPYWYATKTELSTTSPLYVTVSPRSGTSTSMWPNELSSPSLVSKVLFQFDWGRNESNHSVTVQVKGMKQEGNEWVDDNKTYSSSTINLSSADADGIVEIPLTSQVTSEKIQLVFTSTADFSFVPLNIGIHIDYSNYLLVLDQAINTNSEEVQTISASQVSEGNITYNPSSKTLTLNNAVIEGNTLVVETGIEGLNIDIVGSNKITVVNNSLLFKGLSESASIKFTTDAGSEDKGYLSIIDYDEIFDFPGTDAISFENLINYSFTDQVYNRKYYIISFPTAPKFTTSYDENDPRIVNIRLEKDYDGGVFKYSIDYSNEEDNITDATFDEKGDPIVMNAPGIITAWVEVNGTSSENAIGKFYGYINAPYTIAKGSTKETTIYPLITEEDGFNLIFASLNESVATFVDGTITGVAAGTTQVAAQIPPVSSIDYKILNQEQGYYIIALDVTVQELIDENTFTSGQNYGTFYNTSTETYKVPEGLVAYVVTGVTEGSITIAETNILPPNAPVLLYRTNLENATNYTFTQATASDGTFPESNKLEYAYEAVSTDASSKLYVLYNGMFVKVTSGTDIAAKHCYLDLGNTVANTRGFYTIGGGEGTTAIQKVVSEKLANGEWYTLQGQRVTKPAKGLYIRNGKKIVVK